MTVADPAAAEAAAELEDARRRRLGAWLRRRHRGRRPGRLDRWPDPTGVGTLVDVAFGRVLERLAKRVRATERETQASRDRLARLRSIEAETARGR